MNVEPKALLVQTAWENFRGELKGFLINQVGPDASDDLLQDIFVKLHCHQSDLKNTASPRSWLYQVARNCVIDYRRLQPFTTEVSEDILQEEGSSNVQSIQEKLARCLKPMIEELPPLYAQPLSMTEFSDKNQSQVAQELGLSLTALKARVRRGRALLKKRMLQCCEFELTPNGRILDYWQRPDCCECPPKKYVSEPKK